MCDGGGGGLQRLSLAFFHEVYDAVYVEGGGGFLAFVGFQEGEAEGGIHKSVFGKYAGGVGVFEDVEGRFQVGVSVGGVGAEFVAGKVLSGGFVQTGGQFVGEAVAVVGVAAPAGGVVPFLAVAGGVHVDGDNHCPRSGFVLVLPEASVRRAFARPIT